MDLFFRLRLVTSSVLYLSNAAVARKLAVKFFNLRPWRPRSFRPRSVRDGGADLSLLSPNLNSIYICNFQRNCVA